MDMMEENGIVSEADGDNKRKILINE